MSGAREKQLRKAQSISIRARRDQATFDRIVASAIRDRTDTRTRNRRMRRQVFAWFGLLAVGGAIAAALAGVF